MLFSIVCLSNFSLILFMWYIIMEISIMPNITTTLNCKMSPLFAVGFVLVLLLLDYIVLFGSIYFIATTFFYFLVSYALCIKNLKNVIFYFDKDDREIILKTTIFKFLLPFIVTLYIIPYFIFAWPLKKISSCLITPGKIYESVKNKKKD